METVELIIKVSISLFNAIALGFVLIMVSRWHRRMEDKLNEIREYTHLSSSLIQTQQYHPHYYSDRHQPVKDAL